MPPESANPAPAHSFPLRIYYEDTDAGGIVYHASYLRFAERARTEWLRDLGVNQDALKQEQSLGFVVTRLHIDYLRPARLDDELVVQTRLLELGRATLKLRQEVWRAHESRTLPHGPKHRPGLEIGLDVRLASLDVTIACVELGGRAGTGRVARLPEALYKKLAG